MTLRLGILCSHPIQYYTPIFRELAKRVDLQVFYAHRQTTQGQADAGFGVAFDWDIDLLQGYDYKFLQNISKAPDPSRFFGCDSPAIAEEIVNGYFDAFLVLGWGLKSYWQAIIACRKSGVPIMVRGDSRLGTSRSFIKRMIKDILYPRIMRRFDACLYVGEDSKKYFQAYGVEAEKLFFSPHSIDNARFQAEAGNMRRAEAKERLGLPQGKRHVLFAGKFIDKKRPMDFLQAALLLKQQNKSINLLFAGDGPLRVDLELFAAAHDLGVNILGFINQSELPLVYRAADLLVLPSEGSETWGLVVNEGMACGTPAVTSDAVGCSRDLVIHGRTGKIFELGNIPAFAKAIDEVLDAGLSESAIIEHISAYSPEKTAEGMVVAATYLNQKKSRDLGQLPRGPA